MMPSAPEPDIQDLPGSIPVFPLNGALLLPGGKLPLNIFEDRYLNMVRDVLSMEFRAFGMIQSLELPAPGEEDQSHTPDGSLQEVGCLGRLSSFEETGDGRYLISLDGLIRFRVVRELEQKDGYRRVEPSYGEFGHDVRASGAAIDRERLLTALRAYFKLKGFKADWQMIESCEGDRLVTTLSMVCPLSCADKQALLEVPGTVERAETLTSLLEMETAGHATDNNGDGHVIH